jgi:hypothetical protein
MSYCQRVSLGKASVSERNVKAGPAMAVALGADEPAVVSLPAVASVHESE